MEPIKVIIDKCVGCELCVKVCTSDAIQMINKKAVIDIEKCTLCGACIEACKFDAIVIYKRSFKEQEVTSYSGICLYAEHRNGKLASVPGP